MSGTRSQPLAVLLVSLASVFVITWGIKSSAGIINPILLATVITIIVLPMPRYFMKRGLASWLSFVLTLLLVVGGLAAMSHQQMERGSLETEYWDRIAPDLEKVA